MTGRLLTARDDALARVAARGGVPWAVTSVENNTQPGGDWARRVIGQFQAPCYLPNNALPSLDSRLVLDARGLPVFQNWVNFTFEVHALRGVLMRVGGSERLSHHPPLPTYLTARSPSIAQVVIPTSLANGSRPPGKLIQYGHGAQPHGGARPMPPPHPSFLSPPRPHQASSATRPKSR